MNDRDQQPNSMHGHDELARAPRGAGRDRDPRGAAPSGSERADWGERLGRSDGRVEGGRYREDEQPDARWHTDRWGAERGSHDRSSADRWGTADRVPARGDGIEGYGRGRGEVDYGYVRTGGRDFARESDRYEARAESMRERAARMDDVRPAGIGEYPRDEREGARRFGSDRAHRPSPYDQHANHGYGLDGYANDGRARGNRDLGEGGFDSPNFGSMRAIDEGRFGGEHAQRSWMSGERRTAGKPPKGYARTDERVKEDVCDRLSASGHDWSEVEVSVSGGEVTLTGTVTDRAHKFEAEHIADGVRGVIEVTNQLRVQAAGTTERSERDASGNGKDGKSKSARAH